MPLYYGDGTYGYHYTPAEPESITHDGMIYEPLERLPRNIRTGDLVIIGDNTDRYQYHRGYMAVSGVDYWSKSYGAYGRVYEALTKVYGKAHPLTPRDSAYRLDCVARGGITFRGDSSRTATRIYRATGKRAEISWDGSAASVRAWMASPAPAVALSRTARALQAERRTK